MTAHTETHMEQANTTSGTTVSSTGATVAPTITFSTFPVHQKGNADVRPVAARPRLRLVQ